MSDFKAEKNFVTNRISAVASWSCCSGCLAVMQFASNLWVEFSKSFSWNFFNQFWAICLMPKFLNQLSNFEANLAILRSKLAPNLLSRACLVLNKKLLSATLLGTKQSLDFGFHSKYFAVTSGMILDSTQNILQSPQKWFWILLKKYFIITPNPSFLTWP